MVNQRFIYIVVILGLLITASIKIEAQRLNIGVDVGSFAGTKTETVFDEEPFYYLYAAPYADLDLFGNPTDAYFNQVRLVRIWGVSPTLNGNFKFGGNINYQSKNRFNAKLSFGMYSTTDNVYYSFQELMINMDGDNVSYSDQDKNILSDDYISISKWMNSYSLQFSYEVVRKYLIKPYISAGFTERIQLYSSYSSKLTTENYNEEEPQYQNVKKFQDDLFRELQNDGFLHYLNLGFGFKYYSLNIGVSWQSSIGTNNTNYFKKQQFWSIDLSYDLVSIPLFK